MKNVIDIPMTTSELIRVGTYSQIEGKYNYDIRGGDHHRFCFYLHQISDIDNLIRKIPHRKEFYRSNTFVQFYSDALYEHLKELGFYRFKEDWNVPRVIMRGVEYKNEYLRAVIDSIGDINIQDGMLKVEVQSTNINSLEKISEFSGGKLYRYGGRAYLGWNGREALELLNRLNWRFYSYRNTRNTEAVQGIKWEMFI